MPIAGSGMRRSLTKDSCYEYEEEDSRGNFHTIPIQAKLPSEQRLTFNQMKRNLGKYMFLFPCHLIGAINWMVVGGQYCQVFKCSLKVFFVQYEHKGNVKSQAKRVLADHVD